MKLIEKSLPIATFCLCLCIALQAIFSINKRTQLLKTSETIIKLLYQFNGSNLDIIDTNAEALEQLCEPEVFSILDNRLEHVKRRRFLVSATTIPDIQHISKQGNQVIAIVSFNSESYLQDKVILLEYKSDLLHDYKEFVLRDKFDVNSSFSVMEEFDGVSDTQTE